MEPLKDTKEKSDLSFLREYLPGGSVGTRQEWDKGPHGEMRETVDGAWAREGCGDGEKWKCGHMHYRGNPAQGRH